MLTADPRTMNLVALGMAKVTYGALMILKRHLGNDLDLAMIGFAVVMRTRRDLVGGEGAHGVAQHVRRIAEGKLERGILVRDHGWRDTTPGEPVKTGR